MGRVWLMGRLIFVMALGVILTGCGVPPTYDTGALVWVGCHNVDQNPSPEGSKAYLLLSELDRGDKLYLQQIDHKGRSDVTVGSPCK